MHKLFQPILLLLEENEELGVTAIARKLKEAPASVHVYLTKQSYFIQTENKKWRLPISVKDFPLKENETQPNDKTRELIEDPVANIAKIREIIEALEIEADICIRRRAFFRALIQSAVKKI